MKVEPEYNGSTDEKTKTQQNESQLNGDRDWETLQSRREEKIQHFRSEHAWSGNLRATHRDENFLSFKKSAEASATRNARPVARVQPLASARQSRRDQLQVGEVESGRPPWPESREVAEETKSNVVRSVRGLLSESISSCQSRKPVRS